MKFKSGTVIILIYFSFTETLHRVIFTKFLKLDPDPHWEKQLDPDPQKMNAEHSPDLNHNIYTIRPTGTLQYVIKDVIKQILYTKA